MKILLIIISSILVFTQAGQSQKNEFIGGAMLGLYGVHITGEIESFYSPTNGSVGGTGGYSIGFNVRRYLVKNFYGTLDLRYSHKGSIYSFTTNYGTQAWETVELNYIELPLQAGYRIPVKQRHILLETGISLGWLASSKIKVSDLNYWDSTPLNEGFYSYDVSWVANIKYAVIKSKKLLVGFRFTYSLKSIHADLKLYNMDYGLELYYLFNRKVE